MKKNDVKQETEKETEKDTGKWKYDFLYGEETVSGTLLTNFNDGKRGKASYGFASFSEEGMLVKTVSGYAKADAIYSGANLLSADYAKTKYVGIMVENKDSVNAFLGLSAVNNAGKKIHFLQEGSAIALSS